MSPTTRRDLLIGAASTAAAVALPVVPTPRRGSYLWLVKLGVESPFHGSAADLAELDWSVGEWPTMMRVLSVLAHHDAPAHPDAYDPKLARALRCCVARRWAEPAGHGRIRITALGKKEHEGEVWESYA